MEQIKLWTLDTETRGLFGEVFKVGLYDGQNYYDAYTFSELYKYFDAFHKHHVYIHNLDFDLSKIAPEIFSRERINFGNSIIINGNVVAIDTPSFVLHDSYMLLKGTLAKLCESFKIEHGKMNLNGEIKKHGYKDKDEYFSKVDADDPVLNEYLKLDCISLYEIIMKLIEVSEIELDTLVRCPTTPSLAMTVFKTQFADDYKEACSTFYLSEWGQFLEEYVRSGYYGGRTEVFTPYITNGFHYDVNSLYPYVMKKYEYGIGKPEYFEDAEAEHKYSFYKRKGIGQGFMRCDVDIPDMFIPPLPKRLEGKLLFPTGKVSGVWTFFELEYAEKLGCKIEKIHSCLYFRKTAPVFKAYIEHFEHLKVNSTGALRQFAKDMLNTLYGKFGMRRDRSTFIDIEAFNELTEEERNEVPFIIHHFNKCLSDVTFVETHMFSKAEYIQPHLSAQVTSFARIVLLDGLLQQNKSGTVAYCDTDSIAGTAKMPDNMVHKSEFGKWDLEGEILEGIFLQPKLYAERKRDGTVTIKAKGIPKEIRQKKMTWEFYEELLQKMKDGKEDTVEIYNNFKARKKFMTMLKNNEDLDSPRYMKKHINLLAMQKRLMDYKNNTSRPHRLEVYGDLLPNTFESNPEKYQMLLDIDYDREQVDIDVEKFGKIRYITSESVYYQLYSTIKKKYIEKYFSPNGLCIEEFCLLTGWETVNLLYEMGGL